MDGLWGVNDQFRFRSSTLSCERKTYFIYEAGVFKLSDKQTVKGGASGAVSG